MINILILLKSDFSFLSYIFILIIQQNAYLSECLKYFCLNKFI